MSLEIKYTKDPEDELDHMDRLREISRMLHDHDCEVTFTKVDGSVRTMPCTLRESALPKRDPVKETKTKEPNYNNLSVWCLDKQQWRSFRVANVVNVKVIHD